MVEGAAGERHFGKSGSSLCTGMETSQVARRSSTKGSGSKSTMIKPGVERAA